jgi:hypothetical protein
LIRGWEASGLIGVVKADIPTVAEAVTKFFAEATARQLSKSTISKQKNVLDLPPLRRVSRNALHRKACRDHPQRDDLEHIDGDPRGSRVRTTALVLITVRLCGRRRLSRIRS